MYMIVWGKSWVFLGIPRHPPSSAHEQRLGRLMQRRRPHTGWRHALDWWAGISAPPNRSGARPADRDW